MCSYFLLNKSTNFKNNISWRYIKLNLYCGLTWNKMNESLRITFYFMLLYLGQICSVGASWCIGNYSCPIWLNIAWTQVLRRFKPCSATYRKFTMVRICDSGPGLNKAKRLTSVKNKSISSSFTVETSSIHAVSSSPWVYTLLFHEKPLNCF